MSESVDDILGIATPSPVTPSGIAVTAESGPLDTFQFFQRRYSSAYGAAAGLMGLRTAVGYLTVLGVVGGVLGAMAEGMEALAVSVAALVLGSILWALLGILAAFLRVLIDAAVGVAPGLSEDQRLSLVRGSDPGIAAAPPEPEAPPTASQEQEAPPTASEEPS